MTADEWIEKLNLAPHPEGGFFAETYRADGQIPGLQRSYSTAIYFLLKGDQVSTLHRIAADEIWHFYAGSPLTIHVIDADGDYEQLHIGVGEFQAVVPAGRWFGATVDDSDGYSLVGCTVAPGFDFADFELGQRDDLIKDFPLHRDLLARLTH